MQTSEMRSELSKRYPNSAWAKKVAAMPDSQVIAIYLRCKASGVFDQHKPKSIPALQQRPIYYCESCESTWTADNPDLQACRFCGSSQITKKPPLIKIEKDED